MKVLITGASGYIGRYLVDELIEHGHEVKTLTRQSSLKIKDVEIVCGDILKPESFLFALDGVDDVFHNAAYVVDWGKKDEIYRTNVEGTRNIAEARKKKGVDKIIYTSSAGVYGFPNIDDEITEESPKNPLNMYQKSKLDGEDVLKKYEDMNISVIRPPLALGGTGMAGKIILEKIEQGKMTYVGSGDQSISLVHPNDVVQCLRLALENDGKHDTFNVVSFICTIKELFDEIANQLGVDPPKKRLSYIIAYCAAFFAELFATKEPSLTRFRVKSLGTTRKISCERTKKEIWYEPKYDLQSTVKDMVSWYKKYTQNM